ncbi:MAG: hypothetical protein HN405_05005 [Planctomycetes bacterium]|jgi:hypothetical protein|nr:hypothetical protein [Planctomycetota bacterium]MBT4560255.1 hypothetical protein [Planctomycetota bacterium]
MDKQMDKQIIESAAEELRKKLEESEKQQLKIALFGQPGAGKSSLINSLVGFEATITGGKTDTTEEAEFHEWSGQNVVLVDLPGYGTKGFPANDFMESFDIESFDMFLCVFAGKFHDADTEFFRKLHRAKRVCLFVRNKLDSMWEQGKSLGDLKRYVEEDAAIQVASQVKVHFVSCKTGEGMPGLSLAIADNLDKGHADKWARAAKANSVEMLNRKTGACKTRVLIAAGLAAANGLNPVPGVDITIDYAILLNLFSEIRGVFGLDEANAKDLASKISPQQMKLYNTLLKYATKQGVPLLLKKFMKREAARRVGKYVPLVGQVIAGSVGFAITSSAGLSYMKDCHSIAEAILEHELQR